VDAVFSDSFGSDIGGCSERAPVKKEPERLPVARERPRGAGEFDLQVFEEALGVFLELIFWCIKHSADLYGLDADQYGRKSGLTRTFLCRSAKVCMGQY
jgi:hypothetical protein